MVIHVIWLDHLKQLRDVNFGKYETHAKEMHFRFKLSSFYYMSLHCWVCPWDNPDMMLIQNTVDDRHAVLTEGMDTIG